MEFPNLQLPGEQLWNTTDFPSFNPPATHHLAISLTAIGRPLFLKHVQNPLLLQSTKMGLPVVEAQTDIMPITVHGYAEEHIIRFVLVSDKEGEQ